MTIINKSILGDCRDVMRQLVADGVKVQTCITSPPYYGLRDYGMDGQIGLEQTPQAYIDAMVEVFRCLWDLLEDDGTLWLNIGDSYFPHGGSRGNKTPAGDSLRGQNNEYQPAPKIKAEGLKGKDLIGIPWMLAFALRADGWYLRQDIIWNKPNPMPESVTDRCTKSHEYVFLLTKSDRYYYDNDSIKEDVKESSIQRAKSSWNPTKLNVGVDGAKNESFETMGNRWVKEKANKRSVWTITTKSCNEAHFAVMPEELVEPCILAGSKVGDIVFDPFMGSGTVGRVAQALGRKWLGAELNPEYIKIQDKRTAQQSMEFV